MSSLYGVLGWSNFILILSMFSLLILKKMYVYSKNKNILSIYSKMKIYHRIVPFIIVLIALIHGYLALGTIRFHSGSVLLLVVLLNLALGMYFYKTNHLYRLHKIMAILSLLLLINHVFL